MKIFNLTYNELIKQFKKPSIKIMFALILISAMVLPFGISKIPKDPYLNSNLENNKFLVNQAQQSMDDLKGDKTQKGKIIYKYAEIDKEYNQLFIDHKVGYGDWKSEAIENYRDALYELSAIEFVLKGYKQDLVSTNLIGVDPQKVSKYYELSLAKKKEVESKYIKERNDLKNIIEKNDYIGHTKQEIKEYEGFIANSEIKIKEYEKLKAKNPQDKDKKEELEVLKKEAEEAKESISNFKENIAILQFRIDNKIDYDLNNWKNSSINTVQDEIQKLRMKLLSESEYATQAGLEGYVMSYNDYVKNYNKQNTERIENIKKIWYGLENNIPDLKDTTDARSILDKTYELYIIMATIMVIVIGGGIVSTEFSKGTIRLLLIRPVSRWKVLLSKLIAILIVGFSIVTLGIGILYISTGIVFDFETYKIPLLSVVNNEIIKSSFTSYLLPKIATSCASLVFISSLVFMISTIAKNTALAVAISMVLYFGIAPITGTLIASKQVWIVNTLIPYINASYFRMIPSASDVLQNLYGMQMQYTSGAIQLLVASAVMLAITFITFIKKDVKN